MTQSNKDLLVLATKRLQHAGLTGAAEEAWWLVQWATGLSRVELLLAQEAPCLSVNAKKLEDALDQRILQHKPLQYIIGSVPFAELTIFVEPPTLIPRPETEEMVLWLLAMLSSLKEKPLRVLDLCTGSGCIALALGAASPAWQIVGVDIKSAAVALAEKNRAAAKLDNVRFMCGDLFDPVIGEQFDLIVSNPPYIDPSSYASLMPSVRHWEDKDALVAESAGMGIYKRIFAEAKKVLKADSFLLSNSMPNLVCEIGPDQADIEELARAHNASRFQCYRDSYGQVRWLAATI